MLCPVLCAFDGSYVMCSKERHLVEMGTRKQRSGNITRCESNELNEVENDTRPSVMEKVKRGERDQGVGQAKWSISIIESA